jgi:hypothetical protein
MPKPVVMATRSTNMRVVHLKVPCHSVCHKMDGSCRGQRDSERQSQNVVTLWFVSHSRHACWMEETALLDSLRLPWTRSTHVFIYLSGPLRLSGVLRQLRPSGSEAVVLRRHCRLSWLLAVLYAKLHVESASHRLERWSLDVDGDPFQRPRRAPSSRPNCKELCAKSSGTHLEASTIA